MRNIFKYFKNDLVSLWLLYIFILAGISGMSVTPGLSALLFIAALYIIFMVNERGKFIDAILEYAETPLVVMLDLFPQPKRKPHHWLEWVVYIALWSGGIFMAGAIFWVYLIK